MATSKSVIVNIDSNDLTSFSKNVIPHLNDELIELIKKRLLINNNRLSCEEEYEKYKRHDSILIEGTRGSGKSTAIGYLYEDTRLEHETIVLPTIDPNQLDPNTKIINVIIDNIFEVVEDRYLQESSAEKESLFKEICNIKTRIDTLTHTISYNKEISLQEMTKSTTQERVLDKTIHHFAYKVCRFFDKKSLVQPIDDIDMALKFGSHLLATLVKYLQTPRIIPVIALDSGQIYALIKQEYFEAFGFEAKTPLSEIKSSSELTFLKKLPSEHIQKILPPSQKVVLPDMLEIYRSHIEKKYSVQFKGYTKDRTEITLDFEEVLSLTMSILFGYYDTEAIRNPLDYHVTNYLKNKTFRSFLDDIRAVFSSLIKVDKNEFEVDTSSLKNRFRLYSKTYANDRYDASKWFWESYTSTVYERIEQIRQKDSFSPASIVTPNFIEEILMVTPNDAANLGRKEKIYFRIFLQEFFLKHTLVKFKKESEKFNIYKIQKVINLYGYFEFVLRTILPASIFEILAKNRYIDLTLFPIDKLKEFAMDDGYNRLQEIYDEEMVFWPLDYGNGDDGNEDTNKILGVKLEENGTRPYRKWILEFSKHEDIRILETTYFLHPFKALCFCAEQFATDILKEEGSKSYESSLKSLLDNSEKFYQYVPKGSLNQDGGRINKIASKIPLMDEFTITNSTFGIISTIRYFKRFAAFTIYNLFIIQKNLEVISSDLEKYSLSKKTIETLIRIEMKKYFATIYANFINILLVMMFDIIPEKEYKLKLLSDRIENGIKKSNMLLPFIVDDPLLRNLSVLISLYEKNNNKEIEIFIKNLQELYKTFELEKTYYINKDSKKFKKLQKYFSFGITNVTQAIKNYTSELEVIDTYLELFYKRLKSYTSLLDNFIELSNIIKGFKKEGLTEYSKKKFEIYLFSMKKATEDRHKNADKEIQYTKEIFNQLIKIKKESLDNVEKNIVLLIIDAFVYKEDFIELFASYISKVKNNAD